MKIRILTETLEKNRSNTIVAIIFIETSDHAMFPSDDWYDFPVRIVGWWLNEVTKLIYQTEEIIELWFMDGPEFIRVQWQKMMETVRITFAKRTGDGEIDLGQYSVELHVLVRSLISAAETLLQACEHRQWQTEYIDVLKNLLREFVAAADSIDFNST